jgi:hypothetical protein
MLPPFVSLTQTILSSFGWSDQIAKTIREHSIKLSIGLQGPGASGAFQALPAAPGGVREFAAGATTRAGDPVSRTNARPHKFSALSARDPTRRTNSCHFKAKIVGNNAGLPERSTVT